jgi:hypothetical protein
VTVNDRVPDSPPPGLGVNTVTKGVPAAATSPAAMAARSSEPPTYVVALLAPFHLTTEVATNPLPVTVRVKAGLPAATLLGVKVVTAGTGGAWAIVSDSAADSPPPGLGVNTVTEAVPAAATSPAPMAARSSEPPTYVVLRLLPFHLTTELGTKPLPFSVRVNGSRPRPRRRGIESSGRGRGSEAWAPRTPGPPAGRTRRPDQRSCQERDTCRP